MDNLDTKVSSAFLYLPIGVALNTYWVMPHWMVMAVWSRAALALLYPYCWYVLIQAYCP